MVDRDYLIEKPPGPGPLKQYLDLTVLPLLIDAAGAVEAVAERAAVQVRQRPIVGIGVAFGLGCGLALLGEGEQSRERRSVKA